MNEELQVYRPAPPIEETAPWICCPKCRARLRPIEMRYRCSVCGWTRDVRRRELLAKDTRGWEQAEHSIALRS